MAKETKPKNIRATEETHDKFAQLAEENFPNQGAALEAFINAWEIQHAKNAVPERETDIADFDSHIQALQRAFLHSLDVAQNAEARARDELRRKLEAMEEEKDELRRKLELEKDEKQYYKGQIEAANKTAIEAADAADAAKRHAATLETAMEETKQNAAAQIADKQRLIDTLTEQLTEALEKASAAEEAIQNADNLRGELEKNRREHEREQKDAQAAAQVAAAKAEAEKALAISEARNSATTELLKAINENSALKVEVERLKARITLLESPKPTPTNDQQTPPPPEKDTSNASKNKKPTKQKKTQATKQEQSPAQKEIPGLEEARNLTEAWTQYNKAFRASFEGKNAVGGMTNVPKPATTLEEYLKNYPAAAAYLRAENESLKTNYEIASIGKQALDRIKANPDDYAAAIAQMEADFKAYSNRHMWD